MALLATIANSTSTIDDATFAMTVWWECVMHTNATVCMCLGAPLNLLLLWAIVCRSPEEMRVYRKVLMQTSLLDTTFLIISFLVQPVMLVVDETMLMYGVGPVLHMVDTRAHTWNNIWLVTNFVVLISAHYAVPLPFVYRYQLICHGWELSLPIYTTLLAGTSFIALLGNIPVYLFGAPSDERQTEIERRYFHSQRRSVGAVDVPLYSDLLYGAGLITGYTVVIVSTMRIWRHMRESVAVIGSANKKMAEVNRQISVVLILQAVIPLVTEVVPGSLVVLSDAFHFPFRYGCYAACALTFWMPVLNPLCALLVIRPYRASIARLLRLPQRHSTAAAPAYFETTRAVSGVGPEGDLEEIANRPPSIFSIRSMDT